MQTIISGDIVRNALNELVKVTRADSGLREPLFKKIGWQIIPRLSSLATTESLVLPQTRCTEYPSDIADLARSSQWSSKYQSALT